MTYKSIRIDREQVQVSQLAQHELDRHVAEQAAVKDVVCIDMISIRRIQVDPLVTPLGQAILRIDAGEDQPFEVPGAFDAFERIAGLIVQGRSFHGTKELLPGRTWTHMLRPLFYLFIILILTYNEYQIAYKVRQGYADTYSGYRGIRHLHRFAIALGPDNCLLLGCLISLFILCSAILHIRRLTKNPLYSLIFER